MKNFNTTQILKLIFSLFLVLGGLTIIGLSNPKSAKAWPPPQDGISGCYRVPPDVVINSLADRTVPAGQAINFDMTVKNGDFSGFGGSTDDSSKCEEKYHYYVAVSQNPNYRWYTCDTLYPAPISYLFTVLRNQMLEPATDGYGGMNDVVPGGHIEIIGGSRFVVPGQRSGTVTIGTNASSTPQGTYYYKFCANSLDSEIREAYGMFDTAVQRFYVGAPVIPIVTLEKNVATISENNGTATLTARLSATTSSPVTVNFGFAGTATPTSDYTKNPNDNLITVPAGTASATKTITAVPDFISDNNETIIANITSVSANATIGSPRQQTITITDVPAVSLQANPTSITEGQTSTLRAVISRTISSSVTVNLTYAGGATPILDYTSASTITIPANTSQGTITLTAIDDTTVESLENVVANISSVSSGAIVDTGQRQATVQIQDNDVACTPSPTETQPLSCPAGQTGNIIQQRESTCPGPTWGPWTTISDTCVASTGTSAGNLKVIVSWLDEDGLPQQVDLSAILK